MHSRLRVRLLLAAFATCHVTDMRVKGQEDVGDEIHTIGFGGLGRLIAKGAGSAFMDAAERANEGVTVAVSQSEQRRCGRLPCAARAAVAFSWVWQCGITANFAWV